MINFYIGLLIYEVNYDRAEAFALLTNPQVRYLFASKITDINGQVYKDDSTWLPEGINLWDLEKLEDGFRGF